ncbi:hypothetical protein Asd1617_02104 [Shigella dysenteriae 1617]|uniref:Uncharacterized protein n=1 Tax=Shigella dysenteriae 1617 TaxID=754093 RepID=A0A0A6ZTL1_SHIDY|nr:hypothetical protein Asd1617_02104 [Shigella dysenteriae 1617]
MRSASGESDPVFWLCQILMLEYTHDKWHYDIDFMVMPLIS